MCLSYGRQVDSVSAQSVGQIGLDLVLPELLQDVLHVSGLYPFRVPCAPFVPYPVLLLAEMLQHFLVLLGTDGHDAPKGRIRRDSCQQVARNKGRKAEGGVPLLRASRQRVNRSRNSAHFMSLSSFDSRIPYCDWKDDMIREKSSHMS